MSSDCLVLYLEEIKNHYNENPNTLFIIYEPSKSAFFLCGKRKNNETNQMKEYSFYCKNKKNVSCFIETVLNHRVSIFLYNYSYLPHSCDDIDYNTLNHVRTPDKCIIQDNETLFPDHDDIIPLLKMLKCVKNDFKYNYYY
jgi:hypothetical protein